MPVFYLRSIVKWSHTVKAHIGGSKVNIFKKNLRRVPLVPSWLSVTQMRLPVTKAKTKTKILELVIDLVLSKKRREQKAPETS